MRSLSLNHETREGKDSHDTASVGRRATVSELRDYFDLLGHSVQGGRQQPTDRQESTHCVTHRLPSKSVSALQIDTNLGENGDPLRTASVDDLRHVFENIQHPPLQRSRSIGTVSSSELFPQKGDKHTTRVRASKSVDFCSRPASFQGHGLECSSELPNAPQMSLDSSELAEIQPRQSRLRHSSQSDKCASVSKGHQNMHPVVSVQLPFRSRSLALDRLGNSYEKRRGQKVRYRAGSITQRSLSPVPIQEECGNGRELRTGWNQCCGRSPTEQCKNVKSFQMKQNTRTPPFRCTEVTPSNDPLSSYKDTIRLGPVQTDGVYVRSAVVYERLDNKPSNNGTKNFVSVYVVSQRPYPSHATIEATNLWVAENALLSTTQEQTLPPYRTQTLPRSDLDPMPVHKQCCTGAQNNAASAKNFRGQPTGRPFGLDMASSHRKKLPLFVEPVYSEGLPQPLPTPPPVESHRYLLKCSSAENSPDRSALSHGRCNAKVLQKNRHKFTSSSPTRSWSVKSLSPPPFRTPWVSSLRGSKTNLKSTALSVRIDDKKTYEENSKFARSFRSGGEQKSNGRRPLDVRRTETTRIQDTRGRQECMQRAESISRERQAYHERRGSWSPPHLYRSVQSIPSDLESNTEHEIRGVQRHNKLNSHVSLFDRSVRERHQATQTGYEIEECTQTDRPDPTTDSIAVLDVADSGVDVTPITDNFDAKKKYFEKLIRTSQTSERCSYCANCFHCASRHTPRYSPYSSWESDLQGNVTQPSEMLSVYQSETQSELPPKFNAMDNRQVSLYSTPPDKPWSASTLLGANRCWPQQYSSTLCVAPDPPHSTSWPFEYGNCYATNYDSSRTDRSIQHEYYAKPQMAMPKVAPDPPCRETSGNTLGRTSGNNYGRSTTRNEYSYRPLTESRQYGTTNWLSYREYPNSQGIHSPPCRFYMDHTHNSTGNVGYTPSMAKADLATYRGRVKQIVGELNERRWDYKNSSSFTLRSRTGSEPKVHSPYMYY
ncbi:unnamed protein product [Dicrocoelium dendriticum]|nr:unnamed protein product [Dicrocoelium dendriticum]